MTALKKTEDKNNNNNHGFFSSAFAFHFYHYSFPKHRGYLPLNWYNIDVILYLDNNMERGSWWAVAFVS